jgi:hypothetical protein
MTCHTAVISVLYLNRFDSGVVASRKMPSRRCDAFARHSMKSDLRVAPRRRKR